MFVGLTEVVGNLIQDKELDAKKAHTTAQVQLKKDAVKAVQYLKQDLKRRDFDKQKKT
jgi:hypothetical protein